MSRHVRMGYGRLATVALAVVATTWGVGAAVAAPLDATTTNRLAASTTVPASTTTGSSLPGTPLPSGTGSVPGSTSPTPCPAGPGTGGTAPPPPSGFEDGGLAGWTAAAGVTLTNTDAVAADGQRSLRADGVTDTGGIQVPNSAWAGTSAAWHRVTAKVRLAPGSQPAYVQLKPTSGYTNVPGVVRATADAWTTVTAWYWPSTLYWDGYCNGQMYGGSYPVLASLSVLLSGDACGDATHGPVTLFVDDVVVETAASAVTPTGGGPTGAPPQPASTVSCSPAPSSPHTSPTPVCTARYETTSHWPNGYLGTLHVVNSTGRKLPGWTLGWSFPGRQVVTSLWSAKSYRQNGSTVTVTGPDWSVVPAGGSFDVSFTATGTAGVPQSVTLDGNSCGVTAA